MKGDRMKRYFFIIFIVLSITTLGAVDLTSYENKEMGFSFSYPKDWHIQELDAGIMVSSSEEFFNFDSTGAGIVFFVSSVADINSEKPPQTNAELWQEFEKNDPSIEQKSTKDIQLLGKKWLVVEFYEKSDDCNAVFYLLLDGGKGYMIGCIYHPPKADQDYKDIVKTIIQSLNIQALKAK
jgi:hypothetical protein